MHRHLCTFAYANVLISVRVYERCSHMRGCSVYAFAYVFMYIHAYLYLHLCPQALCVCVYLPLQLNLCGQGLRAQMRNFVPVFVCAFAQGFVFVRVYMSPRLCMCLGVLVFMCVLYVGVYTYLYFSVNVRAFL